METTVEKQNLLFNINQTRNLIHERLNLAEEYNYYNQKPINWTLKRHIITTIIISIFSGEVGTLFLIGFPILVLILNRTMVARKLAANKDRIQEITIIYEQLYNELNSLSVIPKDYWSIHALDSFEKYILNKRADDLKECINLWENEVQHQQRMQELQIIQMQQKEIYEEARDAKWISLAGLIRK